ncbi:MAG: lipid A biosynthesis lauroyl acyltransferase [Proteobacteria bacterium]|nr:lipid A biosynthesis lauroyl acyltransferase [Pseudomonadota bacterium]MDA1063585.1 lipid A biosynthesis lauroyl acyltransferase [Pseudomonadota bacterium]
MAAERKALHTYIAPRYWHVWLGLGCLRVVCMLPHRSSLAIGRLLGRLAHRVGAERRAIVRRNIELCFPEKTTAERDHLTREHFAALGMSVVEMGHGRWASDEQIAALCTIENLEYLTEPLKAGRGIILLSAHFTTIEISGRAVRHAGAHFDAVYRRNRSPFVTEILRSGRERSADNTIEKRDIKQMVRRLRAGVAVWYAPDQSYKRKGAVVVPFFGVPTMHATATSTVARLGQAVVVPFFPRRTPEGRYILRFLPPLDNFPTDDPVADVQRYVALMEAHIRTCPEQYFWIHRKFKDLPAGYEDSYADLDAAK